MVVHFISKSVLSIYHTLFRVVNYDSGIFPVEVKHYTVRPYYKLNGSHSKTVVYYKKKGKYCLMLNGLSRIW